MKKSVLRKVLAVALSATVLCGTGFTEVGQFIGTGGISVNASQNASKYGIAGNMTDWGADPDFPMYETETGIYVGKTDELVAGDYQFKVRADSDWDESYGVYEEDCYRTRNSQTSIRVTLSKSTAITVMFDTTGDDNQIWPISYKIGDGDWVYTGKPYETIDFKYKVNYDNTVTITKYTGNGGDVTIPSTIDGKSVTSIGDYAFYDCKGLTSIEIPDSVTEIGDYAFCCCTGLTSIEIPDSVTLIGDVAFCCCTGLTSIKIPDSVTSIGYSAFNSCTGLTSIEIPDSVTCIGEEVFRNCTSLKNIVIPDSVISLGGAAFYECTGLTSVTIGNSVTSIEWEAFQGCTGLTSVTIGNSVTSIDNYAFYGCTGLTSIEIPDSVTSIGDYAFYNCTGLTSIVIPDSVTSIDWLAFSGCKKLTIYGISGSYAETYANKNNIPFVSDISAKEIMLGETVTVNAKAIFGKGNCTYAVLYKKKTESKWTTKQDFGTNDTVTIKPEKATDYEICVKAKDSTGKVMKKYFDLKVKPVLPVLAVLKYEVNDNNTITITKYTGNGGDVVIPDTIDGKSVTEIGYGAFYGCTGLTSIVIPDSVTSIGSWAFSWCTGLTSVTIGNGVTSIGKYAFYLTDLTSVVIPDSVTEIGEKAFYNCTDLTSVTIGNSVTSIGERAFSWCTSLTSIVIPDSVTSIGEYAFEYCRGLTSVVISDSVTSIAIGAFNDCTGLTSIVIPDSVTSIGNFAFGRCESLTSVTIGNSVTSIGIGAFNECTGLTSIVIPDSVTSIGDCAFFRCRGLTSIVIPDSVTSIGDCAFKKCIGLADENGFVILRDGLFDYWGNATSIEIPDSVTYIVNYAFGNYTDFTNKVIPNLTPVATGGSFTVLTSIEIPDSVISIGEYAFFDYTDLISINVSESNTKYSSENGVLFNKNKTALLVFPCVKTGEYTIPDSVTSIGSYAFYKCKGLTSVTIGNSVASIGERAFYGCTSLTSIEIPDSVTEIGCEAFGYYTYNYNYNIGKIDNFTIYGTKNSVAETYANENDIPFVAVLMNTSMLSANEITLGQTVTVNAKASEDNCTYAVLYKQKTQSKWTTAQDFGTNDTVKIKPASVADYDICVKVKDGSGKIVKKYFEVKVNAKLSNTSTLSAENVILGQQVTVNGLAKGGVGEYQYQVLYKQTSQSKWTTAQAFSENATVTFKPSKATVYDVCVKVKDDNGTIVKKTFTVQVNAKLSNTSTISATTVKKGGTVTVNGSAKGGAGNYTYAVFYKQKSQSKWTTKQDFNANAVVSIKPAQATDYDICVKVKDKDGTIVKKYFTVTVTK